MWMQPLDLQLSAAVDAGETPGLLGSPAAILGCPSFREQKQHQPVILQPIGSWERWDSKGTGLFCCMFQNRELWLTGSSHVNTHGEQRASCWVLGVPTTKASPAYHALLLIPSLQHLGCADLKAFHSFLL